MNGALTVTLKPQAHAAQAQYAKHEEHSDPILSDFDPDAITYSSSHRGDLRPVDLECAELQSQVLTLHLSSLIVQLAVTATMPSALV